MKWFAILGENRGAFDYAGDNTLGENAPSTFVLTIFRRMLGAFLVPNDYGLKPPQVIRV